jgi:LmbE family N-acetylglucosaminyl deacetylase
MEEKIVQSLKKMLPISQIEDKRNVLCILPHPDDGEMGAGGTIAKLKSLGSRITYLMVTEGGAGIKGKSREETVKIRKKEQENAAEFLGIDKIIWLNYPDGGRYDINDVREDIKKHIENIDPDLILTVDPFLPYETHQDHKNCGLAAAQAASSSLNSNALIAFFFTAYPNQYVSVDDYWDKKIEAIKIHESQITEEFILIIQQYFGLKAKVYGEKIGCEYAENFKVLFPIMLHCFEEAMWI